MCARSRHSDGCVARIRPERNVDAYGGERWTLGRRAHVRSGLAVRQNVERKRFDIFGSKKE